MTPSQMFSGLLVYCGCKMNWMRLITYRGSLFSGCLMQLVSITSHNNCLLTLAATRVTTQRLKQPICFCSVLTALHDEYRKRGISCYTLCCTLCINVIKLTLCKHSYLQYNHCFTWSSHSRVSPLCKYLAALGPQSTSTVDFL